MKKNSIFNSTQEPTVAELKAIENGEIDFDSQAVEVTSFKDRLGGGSKLSRAFKTCKEMGYFPK